MKKLSGQQIVVLSLGLVSVAVFALMNRYEYTVVPLYKVSYTTRTDRFTGETCLYQYPNTRSAGFNTYKHQIGYPECD